MELSRRPRVEAYGARFRISQRLGHSVCGAHACRSGRPWHQGNNMKIQRLLIASAFVAASGLAQAGEWVGVGVDVDYHGDSANIYFPVKLSPSLVLEPFIGLATDSIRISSDSLAGEGSVTSTFVGAGLFSRQLAMEKTNIYYGGRFSYGFGEVRIDFPGTTQYAVVTRSIEISPTVGLEYMVTAKVCLTAEAAVRFLFAKQSWDTPTASVTADVSSVTNSTRLGVRYYF
jgi:hypothetical protein